MAVISLTRLAAFGNQSDFGLTNINVAIRDLVSPVVLSDGIVLGDRSQGIDESGIGLVMDRILIEKVRIGKTNQPSDFVETVPGTLTFAFPMAGAKRNATATPIDTDFRHETDVGIESILRACGLIGVEDPVGVGWLYTPADAIPLTMKVFISGIDFVFFDVIGDLVINYQGGEVPIAIATLAGKLQAIGADAFPASVDFEEQSTVSSSSVTSIGFSWLATKGVIDSWSLSIINNLEEIIDANEPGGKKTRQVSRDIDLAMTVMADSGNPDFELEELVRTSIATEAITFQVGPTGTGSNPVLAHKITMDSPEVRSVEPTQVGGDLANIVTVRAVDSVAGDELDLLFL